MAAQQFKAGFPPQPLPMDNDAISAWGLRNGDALVLQASKTDATPVAAPTQSNGEPFNSSAAFGSSNAAGALPDGRCGIAS